jgi:MYXO-CTERM domain-containing protein
MKSMQTVSRNPQMSLLKHIGVVAAVAILACVAAPGRAAAGECDRPGPGWIACEDFEAGELGWTSWFDASPFVQCVGCTDTENDPARIRLTNEPGVAHDGDWALHMPGEAAAQYQGGALAVRTCADEKQPGCTLTNHDQLYFRTWVKLAEDHQYVHHFLAIAGSRPDGFWETDGNAGCRPDGERWAGTTVDFNASHELFFYTYFPGMTCDAGGYCSGEYAQNICDGCATKDMACDAGLECCWGNLFAPEPAVVLPKDQWVCLELYMKLNTPGMADGEMAFWIDDEPGHSAAGMHWRDTPELGLNKAFLQHYLDVGDTDVSNRAWFDNVVVSTERIGCGSIDPGPDPTSSSGDDTGTTSAGTSGADITSTSGTAGTSTSGSDASPGGDTTGAGGTTGGSGGATDAGGGCGCRTDDAPHGATGLALVVAGMLVRRRRR